MRNLTTFCLVLFCLPIAAQTAAGGEKIALVVGVQNYSPDQLGNLQFAADDAEETGKALEALGFDVVVMTDRAAIPERKPVFPEDILGQLRRRLRDRDPSDTVVVSLSGHGLQLKDDPENEFGEKETYFCPQRADISNRRTLLAMSAVIEELANCKAGRKLILVDACRNEINPSEIRKKSAEIRLDPAGGIRRSIPSGVVAFFSCSERESSLELKKLGHSVFTFHLLKYLRGEAEESRYPGRQVSLSEMTTYVTSATRSYVDNQFNRDQVPQIVVPGKTLESWELGRLANDPSAISSSIGIKLVKIPAGRFQMGSRDTPEKIAYAFAGETPDSFRNEHPRRQVQISKAFYMGAHEVTRGQFKQFVNERGYRTDLERGVQKANPTGLEEVGAAETWRNSGFDGITDEHPIMLVTLNDARAFCNWLSIKEGRVVRLPTQAEWEYACRAGTDSRYWTGDDPMSLMGAANVPCGRGDQEVATLRWYTGDADNHNNGWAKLAVPLGGRVLFDLDRDTGFWHYKIGNVPGDPPDAIVLENVANQGMLYSPLEYEQMTLPALDGVVYWQDHETREYTQSGLPNKSRVEGVGIQEEFG